MTRYTTTIFHTKHKDKPIKLGYRMTLTKLSQARLRDRSELTPEIDLSNYKCVAVIDWIDLRIRTTAAVTFKEIFNLIQDAFSRRSYVWAEDADANGLATSFRIRFQEPNFLDVGIALEAARHRYGATSRAVIANMEVSIDFWPKAPSLEARGRMHGTLVRHFYIHPDRYVVGFDWPRFVPGINFNPEYIVSVDSRDPEMARAIRGFSNTTPPAPYGSTLYVGEREHPVVSWRIMDKIFDSQNLTAGTRVELDEDEKRTRIEFTWGHAGLSQLGLDTLSSLAAFSLAGVSKDYLQFRRPTFSSFKASGGYRSAAAVILENSRLNRFLNSGVLGLQIMDTSRGMIRSLRQPELKRLARIGKRRLNRLQVSDAGDGTLVAWDEMARRIEAALRHLQHRIRGELSDAVDKGL